MTALDNLMDDIEVEDIPLSPEIQEMVNWLQLKYEKRLAIYPNILSDPIYQHTTAALRLRILGASIEILRGGRYLPHIKKQLTEDLTFEKNELFKRLGKVTPSTEHYEKIINHLKNL